MSCATSSHRETLKPHSQPPKPPQRLLTWLAGSRKEKKTKTSTREQTTAASLSYARCTNENLPTEGNEEVGSTKRLVAAERSNVCAAQHECACCQTWQWHLQIGRLANRNRGVNSRTHTVYPPYTGLFTRRLGSVFRQPKIAINCWTP